MKRYETGRCLETGRCCASCTTKSDASKPGGTFFFLLLLFSDMTCKVFSSRDRSFTSVGVDGGGGSTKTCTRILGFRF